MSHLQEQANKGMNPALAVVDPPAIAGRTREVVPLRLQVEKLGVAAPPAHVEFTYSITVSGTLERIFRISPGQPVIVVVDGCAYAVPSGTLVTIETGELR